MAGEPDFHLEQHCLPLNDEAVLVEALANDHRICEFRTPQHPGLGDIDHERCAVHQRGCDVDGVRLARVTQSVAKLRFKTVLPLCVKGAYPRHLAGLAAGRSSLTERGLNETSERRLRLLS